VYAHLSLSHSLCAI
jgi:hypothetical protein